MVKFPEGQITYNRPLGIDVASWQGHPDWSKVKADNVQFAVTKATEGVDYINPTFDYNWKSMKNQGMLGMAYHYSRPSINTNPEAEVNHFLNTINNAGGLEAGDILALDIEDPNYTGDISSWALFQLEILENIIGYKPVLYTGPWYLESRFKTYKPKLAEYPLWLANYNKLWPDTPQPWQFISIWQFTDKGRVDGISGTVDLNYFNGTLERLALLGKPANVPPVVIPTDPTEDVIVEISARIDKLLDKITSQKAELQVIESTIIELQDYIKNNS